VRLFQSHFEKIDRSQVDLQPRTFIEVEHDIVNGDTSTIARLDAVRGGSIRRDALYHQVRAEIFGFTGDRARCFDDIEAASELGLFDIEWLDRCPVFDFLRGTVRFETLRRTVHDRAIKALAAIEHTLSS
jgi:hypothetical protein